MPQLQPEEKETNFQGQNEQTLDLDNVRGAKQW